MSARALIDCHDCARPVSPSAAQCPHCGSSEPQGPYIFSRHETATFRGEARNDRRLVVIIATFALLGALYGVATFHGTAAVWAAIGFGLAGALIAPPIAFVMNAFRLF